MSTIYRCMKTSTQKAFGVLSVVTALVIVVSAFQTVNGSSGYTTIHGSWLISQAAAGASSGNAPQVVACGDFTLDVTSASPASSSGGTFAGTFTTSVIYNPGSITFPTNEQVTGSWMSGTVLGQQTLRVMFSGSSPAIAGSFASPPTQPIPSTPDPTSYGCTGPSSTDTLFGFVQLPSQGTEGMFIYSTQGVSAFPSS
jgi:hypothetical protein